jgi:CDP-glucose 4,6-dehydratase
VGEAESAVEDVEVTQFEALYSGKRVLLTGHTGFKGSWLAAWLTKLGAEVTGVALDPRGSPNHWELLQLAIADHRTDIRDSAAILEIVAHSKPEIVFHLAAQPLVRASYRDPVDTWASNVQGVVHVLEACRKIGGVRAIVVVTTDKVYENHEWQRGYREDDALGGHDPYSASKAAAELVVQSYRRSFFSAPGSPLLASARAGNVLGGGDWSEDRLIPDLIRATQGGTSMVIRSPSATRPWQHVLESLSGYLLLGQRLLAGDQACARAWNFGPGAADNRSVADMLALMHPHWPQLRWEITPKPQPHEAGLLYLDSTQANTALGWRPVWNLERCLEATAQWYRALQDEQRLLTCEQLGQFVADARTAGCLWAGR